MSAGRNDRTFKDAEHAGQGGLATRLEAEWPAPDPLTEQLLPVEALDADAHLPAGLRQWVMDEADRMPCAPDYIAATAVVAIGSIIGTRCSVAPKASDDWLVTPNLWGGAVGPPAVKKSPAIGAALAPLEGLAAKAREIHKQEMSVFEMDEIVHDAEQKAFETRIKNAAKKSTAKKPANAAGQVLADTDGTDDNDPAAVAEEMRKHRERRRPAPTLRRYKTNDSTVPKLEELLSENPTGMLVMRDELVGLVAGWDRDGHQGEREWYLEAWNGDQAKDTDRISRGSINVPRVCVSIFGGIQPDKLAGYLEQATSQIANDGMVQRFQVLVYPDPVRWEWRDLKPNLKAREAASAIFDALADFDPVSWGAEPGKNGKPPFFRLSPGALAVLVEYSTKLHLVTIPAESESVVQQHLAKYDKLLPALALIFHLVDCAAGGKPGPVSERAARMAVRWCDYLQSHARRCYGLLDGGGGYPARLLLDKIKAGKLEDGFTARDVVRKQWRGLTKDSAVQGALSRLEAAHWLRGKDTEGPGYPTTKYQTNPRISAPAEATATLERNPGTGREDTDATDAKEGSGSTVSDGEAGSELSGGLQPPPTREPAQASFDLPPRHPNLDAFKAAQAEATEDPGCEV